jgi:hypothetical protein
MSTYLSWIYASISWENEFTGVNSFTSPLITNWAINFNAPEGFMVNGKIVPTVASGNLTASLKTQAGTDATASNPIYVIIGGVVRTITGALSISVPAWNTYFNAWSSELATKEIDYFLSIAWNTASNIPTLWMTRKPNFQYQTEMNLWNPFSESWINRSSATADTDIYTNIWRFAATLSAGAGYTWSIPTYTASNLIQRPIYETRWLDWIPTITWGGTAPTSPWTLYAKYKIVWDTTFVKSALLYWTDWSGNSSLSLTTPIATPNDWFVNKLINWGFNNNYDTPISCKTYMNRTASNVITSYWSSTNANNYIIEWNFNI